MKANYLLPIIVVCMITMIILFLITFIYSLSKDIDGYNGFTISHIAILSLCIIGVTLCGVLIDCVDKAEKELYDSKLIIENQNEQLTKWIAVAEERKQNTLAEKLLLIEYQKWCNLHPEHDQVCESAKVELFFNSLKP